MGWKKSLKLSEDGVVVDHLQTSAPFVAISVEQIVVAHSEVKQIVLLDSRRIAVVVLLVRRRYADKR